MGTRTTHETPLTARQAEVLAVFVRLTREAGRPPTVRELMPVLGTASPTGVLCHLAALVKKGKLTHRPGSARGYVAVGEPGCCPTCGRPTDG
jgi:repressor LexA